MGHTRLNPSGNKQNSKLSLRTFAENHLEQQLRSHPLLNRRLTAGLTTWFQELAAIPDLPPPPGPEPSFDTYVSPALKEENRRASEAYFSAISFYALGLAEEVPKGMQDKLGTVMNDRKAELTRTQQAWELGDTAYSQQLETWEGASEEHPQLSAEHRKQIAGFRRRLDKMVLIFNENSKYDEDLEPDELDTFRSVDYQRYVPTHSFFNPRASSGTLFYDFQNNRFQIHFHCDRNDTKARAVRVKLYGEEHGRNFDKAWGLMQHFTKDYPPNWTGVPRPW
jgi:hypothetical protein